MWDTPWILSDSRCPKCNSIMLYNDLGHVCGSPSCTYIERKEPSTNFMNILFSIESA